MSAAEGAELWWIRPVTRLATVRAVAARGQRDWTDPQRPVDVASGWRNGCVVYLTGGAGRREVRRFMLLFPFALGSSSPHAKP